MTFKTWDFRGVFKEDLEGDLEGDLERDLEGELDSKGEFRGDFKQDMEGDLLRSGKVQVWFSLQPKYISFELDSEVGRLVHPFMVTNWTTHITQDYS